MNHTQVIDDYLLVHKDRTLATTALTQLAIDFVNPANEGYKDKIAESMKKVSSILHELDQEAMKLADQIEIDHIFNLIIQ